MTLRRMSAQMVRDLLDNRPLYPAPNEKPSPYFMCRSPNKKAREAMVHETQFYGREPIGVAFSSILTGDLLRALS